MNLKTSKKSAMALAALLIMIFHLWIPVFPNSSIPGQIERFIIAGSYFGVDIFFFVSAYVLTLNPVQNYSGFIKDRALKLIPLFIIAYASGHFLWFLPALMIVYLTLSPLLKIIEKRKYSSPVIPLVLSLLIWGIFTFLFLKFIDKDQSTGIFLFRIPSVILGAFAAKYDGKLSERQKLSAGIILTVIGIALVYTFGYVNRIRFPFKDTFYLTGIVLMIGILLLTDLICDHIRFAPLEYIGSISLELYFVQVVLGSWLVSLFFNMTGIRIATNILVFLIVFILSALLNTVIKRINRLRHN